MGTLARPVPGALARQGSNASCPHKASTSDLSRRSRPRNPHYMIDKRIETPRHLYRPSDSAQQQHPSQQRKKHLATRHRCESLGVIQPRIQKTLPHPASRCRLGIVRRCADQHWIRVLTLRGTLYRRACVLEKHNPVLWPSDPMPRKFITPFPSGIRSIHRSVETRALKCLYSLTRQVVRRASLGILRDW